MQQAERAKNLASEIAGLLMDVRANIGVSRDLLDEARTPGVGIERGQVQLVIPEMGFFTWFVSGNLFHGDKNFGRLHGFSVDSLSLGIGVEEVLARIERRDQSDVANGLHDAILSGGTCSLDYVASPDGVRHNIKLLGSCLRNNDGLPSFFCGIAVEKKQAVFVDGSDPYKAYCDAALALARERGNLLAARYLSSALNSARPYRG